MTSATRGRRGRIALSRNAPSVESSTAPRSASRVSSRRVCSSRRVLSSLTSSSIRWLSSLTARTSASTDPRREVRPPARSMLPGAGAAAADVDVLTVLPPDERVLLVDDDGRRDDAVVLRVVRRAGADFFEVLATTFPLPIERFRERLSVVHREQSTEAGDVGVAPGSKGDRSPGVVVGSAPPRGNLPDRFAR